MDCKCHVAPHLMNAFTKRCYRIMLLKTVFFIRKHSMAWSCFLLSMQTFLLGTPLALLFPFWYPPRDVNWISHRFLYEERQQRFRFMVFWAVEEQDSSHTVFLVTTDRHTGNWHNQIQPVLWAPGLQLPAGGPHAEQQGHASVITKPSESEIGN